MKTLQLIFFRGVKTLFGGNDAFSGMKKNISNNNIVIDFDPIQIKTCSAPQNDRQHLLFVKDIHVDAKK